MSKARARLDREAVVRRALELVDAEGLEALTIRRLAEHLQVTPMALYWHFRNKDELLDALVEHLFASVVPPDPDSAPGSAPGDGGPAWAARLRAALAALAGALRPHPALAGLVQSRVLFSEPGLRVAERALGLLRDAGFSAERAAQIGAYLLGAVVALVASEPGVGEPNGEDHIRARRAALLGLPPSEYPHVVACAEPLTWCENDDAYFAVGLDLLVAGVRALA